MAAGLSVANHGNKGRPFRWVLTRDDYCDNSAERYLLTPVKRTGMPQIAFSVFSPAIFNSFSNLVFLGITRTEIFAPKPNEKLFLLLGSSSLHVNSSLHTILWKLPIQCKQRPLNKNNTDTTLMRTLYLGVHICWENDYIDLSDLITKISFKTRPLIFFNIHDCKLDGIESIFIHWFNIFCSFSLALLVSYLYIYITYDCNHCSPWLANLLTAGSWNCTRGRNNLVETVLLGPWNARRTKSMYTPGRP